MGKFIYDDYCDSVRRNLTELNLLNEDIFSVLKRVTKYIANETTSAYLEKKDLLRKCRELQGCEQYIKGMLYIIETKII